MRPITKSFAPSPTRSPRWLRSLSVSVLTAAVIVWSGLAAQFFWSGSVNSAPSLLEATPVTETTPVSPPIIAPSPTGVPTPLVSPSLAPVIPTPLPQPPKVQTKYGHFPYAQAASNRLVSVGRYYDRPESLDQEAAAAFKTMVQVANKVEVKIIPISGFRSISEQVGLFERQIHRRGSPQAAAFLSAPAGYSEHHTGYAIDLGDGNAPQEDLRYSFEQTAAYRWMQKNASTFGFELSFPDKNPQGISFEPWHWRYISSARAAAIFAAARANRI